MNSSLLRFFPLVALAALWLTGCSTPTTRIEANPEAFARLTPQQQALVRAGQIGLGFDAEAVRLALGEPDRMFVRTDTSGEVEIWHYVTYEAGGTLLYTGYYHTGRRWWGWGPMYPYYLDYPSRQVRDRFRVEFKDGRVTSITEERST